MAHRPHLILLSTLLLAIAGCSTSVPGTQTETSSGPVVIATIQPTILPSPNQPLPATPTTSPTATLHQTTEIPPTLDLTSITIDLQQVVEGFNQPVGIANAGDGSQRLFIVEKRGIIRILRDGALIGTPFLDISDRVGSSGSEQGLLGLAFHPGYADNGLFFVNYTDLAGNTVISRFSVTAEPDQANPDSELVLLTLEQPASNHNGGHLAFGPDGFLYIGMGDGGAAGDKFRNAQNGQTLLGAILRLDVAHASEAQPYAIPVDNPFIGDPTVRDEIWAIGLRNPWRYSFDRVTGDLYIADVGQDTYEEINIQPADSTGGENYGWPIMEGQHCYPGGGACSQADLALPVVEYQHSYGCSVAGGYVYRGQEFQTLTAIYFFGDYCSGRVWGLMRSADGGWQVAQLAQGSIALSSFGEDEEGELYVLDFRGGVLYKIVES